MRKLFAPLLLGMVAMGMGFAPAASAEHHEFDCGFDTIAQQTVTGGQDTFTGVAYGYVVSPTPGEHVEVSCWVSVDSNAATPRGPRGTATNFATYAQQVTYTASDTQDVDLCADVYTDTHGLETTCFETTTTQIPPQEVIDALNGLIDVIDGVLTTVGDIFGDATGPTDPLVCGALQAQNVPAAVNGLTSITGVWMDPDDCDIWVVRNTVIFICPIRVIDFIEPYGDAPRSDMPACF